LFLTQYHSNKLLEIGDKCILVIDDNPLVLDFETKPIF